MLSVAVISSQSYLFNMKPFSFIRFIAVEGCSIGRTWTNMVWMIIITRLQPLCKKSLCLQQVSKPLISSSWKASSWLKIILGENFKQEVFAPCFLCMGQDSFDESTGRRVAQWFFWRTSLMAGWIFRILKLSNDSFQCFTDFFKDFSRFWDG